MRISRFAGVPVAVAAGAVAFASPALADAPKFHAASASVNGAGALVVDFDERGLGSENIDYALMADASATYACLNGGGNHPQAANKETVNAAVSAGGSFAPKNGRVLAGLTAAAPSAGAFSCPPGQRLVLAAVSYSHITLTDTTNAVSTSVADAATTLVEIH